MSLAAFAAGSSAQGPEAPALGQLVGQRIMVRIPGPAPGAPLLARIRRGEIGGVVLFGDNFRTSAGARRLIQRLQAAARAGGQLPLLIAIDQEGGAVKRLPGPPTKAPSAMRSVSAARAEGLATGRYLRGLGIALNLAPVLDVPASPRAFIAGRAFSSDAKAVGARGTAFAAGLDRGGVAAAAKHFPGLGRLARSTDYTPGRIAAARGALSRDLAPFTTAIRAGVPTVMIGTATYPAFGSKIPAACSPAIVSRLLRGTLGFRGVTISDDLNTPGVRPIIPLRSAVVRAARAGVDLIYVSGSAGGKDAGVAGYAALLEAARHQVIPPAQLRASYARILEFKQRFAESP